MSATTSDAVDFGRFGSEQRTRIERVLEHWLAPTSCQPNRLHEAIRYAVLGGGKRIRPLLVYAAGSALGVDPRGLDGPACAVELIHAYSLAHDDLPCMDDDDLRRGKPTVHKVFGEAMALLVGDALQSLAFYVLAHDPAMTAEASCRLEMIATLAHASGSRGMVGGQAIDLAAVGQTLDLAQLENMHIHKTGALIRASVKLAALCAADAGQDALMGLDRYAKFMGLAFQIQDDILDAESPTETLGKRHGADSARQKPTYTSLLGIAEARREAFRLREEALAALSPLGTAGTPLRALADFIITRQN